MLGGLLLSYLYGKAFNQRLLLRHGQLVGSGFNFGERAHFQRLNHIPTNHQAAKPATPALNAYFTAFHLCNYTHIKSRDAHRSHFR